MSDMPKSSTTTSDKTSIGIVIAILAFFFLIFTITAGSLLALVSAEAISENAIGVIEVKGVIQAPDQTLKNIRKFSEDESLKAILVRIDSPGGSVSASQEIVEAIQMIQKPVVISMGDMAASGGYYVACAGPEIFASPGTLTGSIGVISQVLEIKDLMDFFKVTMHTVKTGDLKDAGSPYRAFNETDNAYFMAMGLEILDQFIEHVANARHMTKEQVTAIADGRVWTGREAKKLGLIDELGGMNAALEALKKKAGIVGDYTLVYPAKDRDEFLNALLAEGAGAIFTSLKASTENVIQKAESFQYLYRGE